MVHLDWCFDSPLFYLHLGSFDTQFGSMGDTYKSNTHIFSDAEEDHKYLISAKSRIIGWSGIAISFEILLKYDVKPSKTQFQLRSNSRGVENRLWHWWKNLFAV